MRLIPAALCLALAAAPALAEPRIVVCSVDLPASEGAWVELYQEGEEIRFINLVIAGEMGAVTMGVTPMGTDDAIADYERLEYSRHAFAEEGPIDIFVRDTARLVVTGGEVCPSGPCGFDESRREELTAFWADFVRAYAGRTDCSEVE